MFTVKTICNAGIFCLLFIFNAVKIHVVNNSFFPIFKKPVFINKRKSGTAKNIPYFFMQAKCMNEGCFSRTHLTMKSKYSMMPRCLPKQGGCSFQIFGSCEPFHHSNLTVVCNHVKKILSN